MLEELENISMKKIINIDQIALSSLEENLAERFQLTAEQLRNLIMESHSFDELMNKIKDIKEV